jgi:glutamyl-tRNA synthetase
MFTTAPRLRFAPSPTGFLHVGGARTALFNWLFARKTGGTLLLRIEDTDAARSTDDNTQVILDGLLWLGLDWDEGPHFQGAEIARHQHNADRLLAEAKAYRCFCTREELEAERKATVGGADLYKYDRRCGRLPPDEIEARLAGGMPFVIRFRMPDGEIAWEDAIHGRISFQGAELDDLVILRSDRTPIYNLAVVSDDITMRITHVIRGDDHISNTPKQIALYRALGAPIPVFGHVPMILGADGKKLSKRHGATAVGDYQHQGILPDAMRNFLGLLGWNPGDEREIMTAEEMAEAFTLEAIQKKPAIFDTTKLEWMNGQYISAMPTPDLVPLLARELLRMDVHFGAPDLLPPYIDAVKSRARTILQLAERVAVRLDSRWVRLDDKGTALIEKMGPAYGRSLRAALDCLRPLTDDGWTAEAILEALKRRAETEGIKLGDLLQPIRVAVTGSTVSESVNELLAVVGRSSALARLTGASSTNPSSPV